MYSWYTVSGKPLNYYTLVGGFARSGTRWTGYLKKYNVSTFDLIHCA